MFFNFNLTAFLILIAPLCCRGFEFTFDRREFLIKGRTYCGLLQCKVDSVSDTNMMSLNKLDIYYLRNEQLLATMLADNSEIQAYTGDNTTVIGSMSKDLGEFHVYFSDVTNCSQTAFICKIQFQNSNSGLEIAEKITLPVYSDRIKTDTYFRSKTSFEDLDKFSVILNILKSPAKAMTNFPSDELLMERIKPSQTPGLIADNNFEQRESELVKTIRDDLKMRMIQFDSKIDDIKLTLKDVKSLCNREVTEKPDQLFYDLIEKHINSKLSNLDRKIDDINERIEQGNDPSNSQKLNALNGVNTKMNFSMIENKHFETKMSNFEIKITEIFNNQMIMNTTLKEIQEQLHIIKLLNKGELSREILQSLTLLHTSLKQSNLLEMESRMEEVLREMKFINLTVNALNHNVNEQSFQDVSRNKTEQQLSSLGENLKELIITLEPIKTLFINVTRTVEKSNIYREIDSKLTCGKGMSLPQSERMITTMHNKQVLCDTETDGGGWIIIQRRIKGNINFTRNWNDYKKGFGSFYGDFWLGNDLISDITLKDNYQLRIDMKSGNNTYYVTYDSFILADESMSYTLRLGKFKDGNIRDSLSYSNNKPFATPDRDEKNKCASGGKSAWWYDYCSLSDLNAVWNTSIYWYEDKKGGNVYMNYVEMKIRIE